MKESEEELVQNNYIDTIQRLTYVVDDVLRQKRS